MKRGFSISIAILLTVVLLFTCATGASPSDKPIDEPPRPLSQLTANEKDAIHAFNDFGWKLFEQIYEESDVNDNIFISPLSVSYALGMALNGADGDTREQIKEVMELNGLTMEQVNTVYHELSRMLEAADPDVAFSIANSFWYRRGKTMVPDYLSTCRDNFDAPAEGVDFTQSATVDRINQWVSDKTEGNIDRMINNPMDPSTVSLILNAIYFKGSWTMPFRTENTMEDWFYMADGDSVQCQMMEKNHHDDEEDFGQEYLEKPILVFIKNGVYMGATVPYGSRDFVMTILVPDTSFWSNWGYPDTNTDLSKTVDSLDAEKILKLASHSSNLYGYEISLPKFRFAWDLGLSKTLQSLGFTKMFAPDAGFSNMFSDGGGQVSDVKHSSFVQIDEKGTKAAVSTGLPWRDAIPPWVRCNRPFLFVIQERESEAILFIGKIGKPVWEE